MELASREKLNVLGDALLAQPEQDKPLLSSLTRLGEGRLPYLAMKLVFENGILMVNKSTNVAIQPLITIRRMTIERSKPSRPKFVQAFGSAPRERFLFSTHSFGGKK